jgi:hypothetical protein
MITNICKITILILFLTSCSVTYHKKEFKKFDETQSQNHLIKKNGYYYFEKELYKKHNYVPFGTGVIPTDSTLTKSIRGILFYENSKVYITMSDFDGINKQGNSLKIAQNKLEKRIEEFDLKTIDKKENLISNLGKYSIHNDTITIQYYRHLSGNRLLTELKGVFLSYEQFILFQRKNYQIPTFGFKTKPKIYKISNNYKFKEY